MQEKRSIIIISSKKSVAFTLVAYLEFGPFTVAHAELANEVLQRIVREAPDIVMVHAERSNRMGLGLCAEIRALNDGLVILCMDYEDEQDQILAYKTGVDDIIVLPTSPRLLIAKLNARLRREKYIRGNARSACITIGDVRVDASRREAFLNDKSLHLTTIQFDLLWYLMQNAGIPVTRDNLCQVLFDSEYNGIDRAIDVYISRIRQKLRDNPRNPAYVKTVRGVGYLFAGN
ncbi:MAG: response regulator transcription factor [Syntrophaceae bacterium]